MTDRIFEANDESVGEAIAFVEEKLDEYECPMKAVMQITVCLEEMFVNVVHYAYEGVKGQITLSIGYEDGTITIVLTDTGIPFDPLAKEDPDITLSANERSIGGLGIFMVKKMMSSVDYVRVGNKNIFTMKKEIG